MAKKQNTLNNERWLAEHKARHAEWERLAAENEAKIEAEMNARCPVSDGWTRINSHIRIRAKRDADGPLITDCVNWLEFI